MRREQKVVGGLCSLMAAAVVTASYVGDARATEGVLVMFDRSGSMRGRGVCDASSIGVATPSKAECGIFGLFLGPTPRLGSYNGSDAHYYFWEFSDDGSSDFIHNDDTASGVPGIGAVLPSTELTSYTQLTNTLTTALNHLGTNPVVGGPLTPLAQTYCRAVSWLTTRPQFDSRTIYIVSDGIQEPISAAQLPDCNGPASAISPASGVFPNPPYFVLQDSTTNYFLTEGTAGVGDLTKSFLDVGSWMSNMFDVGISGGIPQGTVVSSPIGTPANQPSLIPSSHPFPTSFPSCNSSGICTVAFTPPANGLLTTTSVQFIEQFQETSALRALSFSVGGGGGGDSDGDGDASTAPALRLLAAAATTPPDFLSFLDGLSRAGGGRLIVPGNAPGDPFGTHAVAGDIDDSGVVDLADFDLLKQSFGLKVSPTDPAAAAADTNLDGIVNDLDYLVIKNAFPAVPVFSKVLFGFGDAANWVPITQGTPLSVTTTRSEGARALMVGGLNFREIKTVKFNTALFSEMTPSNKTKLLVDVFLPADPPNPFWLGDVHLLVNCPSAGLFNVFVGEVGLTGGTPGTFKKDVTFNLPFRVRNAINTSHSDFSIRFVVNAGNYTGHVLDNIHFL